MIGEEGVTRLSTERDTNGILLRVTVGSKYFCRSKTSFSRQLSMSLRFDLSELFYFNCGRRLGERLLKPISRARGFKIRQFPGGCVAGAELVWSNL